MKKIDDMQALKNCQIEMLKTFIEICKKNNLQYFLLHGSCIGAVRHKGFIPWDDDIDVGMPREDYDRFTEIAKDQLPMHLFFQTFETDPEYPTAFGKIRNSNTTYIEKASRKLKINHGVYIDVFPLDGVPNGKISQRIQRIKRIVYNISISRAYSLNDTPGRNAFKRLLIRIICLIYHDVKKTIIKRDKLFRKYPYSLSCEVSDLGGHCDILPKNVFGKGTIGVFEGVEVVLPEKYDEYLSKTYGDYMKLPPVEKRVGHHFYEIKDANRPYKDYFDNERLVKEVGGK